MPHRGPIGLAVTALVIGGAIMLWQRVPDKTQRGLKTTLGVIISVLLLATLLTNLTRCVDYFAR